MQDRVGLDVAKIVAEGGIGSVEQAEIYDALSTWRHCLGEALQLNAEGDPRGASASSYYKTVAAW